jgi:hypothetical protein
MDLPKCKICGDRHRLGGCPTSSGGGDNPSTAQVTRAARGKSDPAPPEAKRGLRVPALKSHALIGDGIALTSIAHPPGLINKIADAIRTGKLPATPTKPKFDRAEYHRNYMRDYMRKRRKKEQEK